MKNTARILIFSTLLTFAVAGAALATGGKHDGRFGADAVLVYKTTSIAKVAKVEGENLVVTDEKSGKALDLQVSDKTKIKDANGAKVGASTLTAGQRVEIVHRGEQVLKITVLS